MYCHIQQIYQLFCRTTHDNIVIRKQVLKWWFIWSTRLLKNILHISNTSVKSILHQFQKSCIDFSWTASARGSLYKRVINKDGKIMRISHIILHINRMFKIYLYKTYLKLLHILVNGTNESRLNMGANGASWLPLRNISIVFCERMIKFRDGANGASWLPLRNQWTRDKSRDGSQRSQLATAIRNISEIFLVSLVANMDVNWPT